MAGTWVRDPVVEKRLNDMGAKWEFDNKVPISTLDVKGSRKNNARFEAINENIILKYAAQMEEGSPFPAIVITPSGLILAGNNRIAATELVNIHVVAAYRILNGTPDMYDEFIRTDNTRHGLALAEDEAILHCIFLHRQDPAKYPLTSLCKQFFGSNNKVYSKVVAAWHTDVVRSQLIEQTAVDVSKISASLLSHLHPLAPSQSGGIRNVKLLERAASAVAKYKMYDAEVRELVKAIKNAPDEKQAIWAIEEYSDLCARKRKQPSPPPLRAKFLQNIHRLEGVLESGDNGKPITTLKQAQIRSEEVADLIKVMNRVTKRFNELKKSKKDV